MSKSQQRVLYYHVKIFPLLFCFIKTTACYKNLCMFIKFSWFYRNFYLLFSCYDCISYFSDIKCLPKKHYFLRQWTPVSAKVSISKSLFSIAFIQALILLLKENFWEEMRHFLCRGHIYIYIDRSIDNLKFKTPQIQFQI